MRAYDPLEQESDRSLDDVMSELQAGDAREVEEAEEAEELPRAVVHFEEVVAPMAAILEGREVDLDALAALTAVERQALDHLVFIVNGRVDGNQLVYAEDRLAELQRVLAALQPALSVGAMTETEATRDAFSGVVDRLSALRDELEQLEAAEEEPEHREQEAKATAAPGDQDEPDAAESPDEERPWESTLSREPEAVRPPWSTTLTGDPEAVRPPWKTTLTGEDEPR